MIALGGLTNIAVLAPPGPAAEAAVLSGLEEPGAVSVTYPFSTVRRRSMPHAQPLPSGLNMHLSHLRAFIT